MQQIVGLSRLSSMTHEDKQRGFLRRISRARGLWISLAVVAVLPLIALAIEVTRWHRLPGDPTRGSATATPAGPEIEQARLAVAQWMSGTRAAGLSVCVGTAGRVTWCEAYGYADIGERIPMTAETSMRLGSVSKSVTSILLARLVESGLIDLDQPIGQIRPDLPAHLQQVTPRQLASHTAGVRHYRWRLGWPPHETSSRTRYASVDESLEVFVDDSLVFSPGHDFAYSSHGYTLLGSVLKSAGDAAFGDLLAREITDPLGLDSIQLDSHEPAPDGARHYEISRKWYRNALVVDNSRAWPGAGLRSSAPDLVRLVSGLTNGELIGSDTLERILTPQALPDGTANPQNYALGWRLGQTKKFLGGHESYRVAHHGGVSSGSSAFVLYFPDQSLAVAVLANSRTGSGPLGDLAFDVAEPFMAELVAAGSANVDVVANSLEP